MAHWQALVNVNIVSDAGSATEQLVPRSEPDRQQHRLPHDTSHRHRPTRDGRPRRRKRRDPRALSGMSHAEPVHPLASSLNCPPPSCLAKPSFCCRLFFTASFLLTCTPQSTHLSPILPNLTTPYDDLFSRHPPVPADAADFSARSGSTRGEPSPPCASLSLTER